MTNSDAIREFAEVITQQILTYLRAEACFIGEFENEIRKKIEEQFTARISEHYYPREFVEWWGKILIETHGQYGSMEIPIQIGGLRTMDEIFEYWKENER